MVLIAIAGVGRFSLFRQWNSHSWLSQAGLSFWKKWCRDSQEGNKGEKHKIIAPASVPMRLRNSSCSLKLAVTLQHFLPPPPGTAMEVFNLYVFRPPQLEPYSYIEKPPVPNSSPTKEFPRTFMFYCTAQKQRSVKRMLGQ